MPRPRARRPAHARRLADHGPRAAAPRRLRLVALAQGARAPTASRSSTSISAAGLASPTTARSRRRRRSMPRRCCPIVRDSGLPIILEPGRSIVGPAGALLTRGRRRQGAAGREAVRDSRCRDDRADPADALQRLPSHRAGGHARRPRRCSPTSSGRSARAATRSARTGGCRARRSAISSRCSMPAPTGR